MTKPDTPPAHTPNANATAAIDGQSGSPNPTANSSDGAQSKSSGKPFEDVAAQRATLIGALARLFGVLLRKELMSWRPLIALAFVFTVVAKGLSVTASVFLADGINALDQGGDTALTAFFWMAATFAGARFLAMGLPYVRDIFFVRVTQDAMRVIATQAFAAAQKLPLRFHLTRRTGALNRIIERGAGSLDYLLRFLGFNIAPTLIELTIVAGVFWVRLGPQFAIAAVVTVLAYIVFTVRLTEFRTKQKRVVNEADSELRARAVDSLSNFETVKAFAAEEREADNYDRAHRAYNRLYIPFARSLSVMNLGQELIMTAGLAAGLVLAGLAVAGGGLGIGDVTLVVMSLMSIFRPLNILGWAWREIKQSIVDIEKLYGIFDLSLEVEDKPGAPALATRGGQVVFDNVSFTHDGRASGLQGVSFTVPAGGFVGLVGPSGAGKSTVLRLLFRFYDPSAGRVMIDGQDVRDVTQTSVRETLGLVPQDVVLFNDTLRANIAYARPDAPDDDILAAAAKAQLGEFIASLPDGLDTRVGERGLKLSGGEKQRVGVARAILSDPQILILDEATSSLDSATETQVQHALSEAARGRTTIAVAHRLSTIAGADRIIVLDDGRIAEQGTHDDLLAMNGIYADMWATQARVDDTDTPVSPGVAAATSR